MTTHDLFERWLRRQHGRPSTITKYRDTLARAETALGPERAVDTVTGLDIDELFSVTWSGLAGSTLTHRLSVLRNVFRYAVGLGLTEKDPVAWFNRPRRWGRDRKLMHPLSREEATELVRALDTHARRHARLATLISLYTGLRIGNVVGPRAVRWEDIDLERGELRIDGGRMKAGWPLEVPVGWVLLRVLREAGGSSGPVVGARNVRHAFRAAGVEALGREVRPNELRSTFATWLETIAFAPRGVTKTLLAHASGDLTDRYTRVTRVEDLRKWVDRLPPVFP